MDILKQCQKWHEEDKHQKIIDALEAIPAEERTPEIDMELARAYNNLADPSEPEGRKLLHRALELMKSHEEELGDTNSWNFRMGYAYYYLDQEGRALRYFEKALELHPGDDPKLNTRQDIGGTDRLVQEGHFPAAVLGVLPGADRELVGNLCRDGSRIAPDDGRGQGSHPWRRTRGPNGGGFESGF